MTQLLRFIADTVLEFCEGIQRIQNMFARKKKPSLIAANIDWCTRSEWMDRLVSYKQLDLWTNNR